MAEKPARDDRALQLDLIVKNHFGKMMWVTHVGSNRKIFAYDYPKAHSMALVVCDYDRSGGRMVASEIFLPVAHTKNTWADTDKALTEYERTG